MIKEEKNVRKSQKLEFKVDYFTGIVLPCPFCGEKPDVNKYYMPSSVEISCSNDNCHVRPSVNESVRCVEQKGETVSYKPMFEWHWQSVLDKWNIRY
jgi:hypothetical protein